MSSYTPFSEIYSEGQAGSENIFHTGSKVGTVKEAAKKYCDTRFFGEDSLLLQIGLFILIWNCNLSK